jgi:hypothetical protein
MGIKAGIKVGKEIWELEAYNLTGNMGERESDTRHVGGEYIGRERLPLNTCIKYGSKLGGEKGR